MEGTPLQLTACDFAAFGGEQAGSTASARARAELRRRALAWAGPVVARLGRLGVPLEVHADDGDDAEAAPAGARPDRAWIAFVRDAVARATLQRVLEGGDLAGGAGVLARHAALALRFDAAAVEVCFAVFPAARVDVENFRARLAGERALPGELVGALEALPEQFAIGVGMGDRVPCAPARPDAIARLLDRAEAERTPLRIGWRVPRDTAVEHAALLDEQLEDALAALAPVYRLAAWSRDNDLVLVAPRLVGAARAPVRPAIPGTPVEKGARVRVRSGPFSDKLGIVSEVDGRGAARVMLGLLSSRFEVAELEPVVEGRERPAFQSSHRRPMAQVPRKVR